MLKKTIKYTDYNGEEREEDFYFNLNKAEIVEMDLSETGTLTELINTIVKTKDVPQLIKLFKIIILKAYGVKSSDGKRFIKSDEISKEFSETEAFVELYMELISDADKASEFINNIVPKDIREKASKQTLPVNN